MKASVLGWDVGGANVKAVRVERGNRMPPAVVQRAFPLWREPDRLPDVLAEIADGLGGANPEMAITMTAELADCFRTKRDGVVFVLDAFGCAFPGIELQVFGMDGRFRSTDQVREDPLAVAAANWMASATFVARAVRDAILLDVGSTTTDIIPIADGRVVAQGRTDAERLATGELVYTGALRTPVCAIVRSVPLSGRPCRVAAEHFAVAADVHLWLGHITAGDYTCETADGRGRSRPESGARLARMVCADPEQLGEGDITAVAEHVADAQVRQIAEGIAQVRERLGPGATPSVVLSGQGSFLGVTAADTADLPISDPEDKLGPAFATAGPAAAVAYLAAARCRT